ncbi:recombinase family protein [Nonomuraea muscovyensis]|uniref:recombinase family protein n=1 Tax=Nonomuraea muscovyensis TaxID=1124761 RepID=UPI0035E4399C
MDRTGLPTVRALYRPAFGKIAAKAHPGDTLTVSELFRLCRDLVDIHSVRNWCQARGVVLRVLSGPLSNFHDPAAARDMPEDQVRAELCHRDVLGPKQAADLLHQIHPMKRCRYAFDAAVLHEQQSVRSGAARSRLGGGGPAVRRRRVARAGHLRRHRLAGTRARRDHRPPARGRDGAGRRDARKEAKGAERLARNTPTG